ncbi:MAG: hypothetical protein KBD78_09610 [Oligoflexales bacterium]|nr:hypothetical protein [Oligoflexales bacterium]
MRCIHSIVLTLTTLIISSCSDAGFVGSTAPEPKFDDIIKIEPEPEPKPIPKVKDETPVNLKANITILKVLENSELTISTFDISNPDGLKFEVAKLPPSKLGVLQLLAEPGQFMFKPNPKIHGEEKFEYIVKADANIEVKSILHIIVESVNEAPIMENLELSGEQDSEIHGQLLAIDGDADEMNYELESVPENGILELDTKSGKFIFTPLDGFFGEVKFTAKSSDGELESNIAEVKIVIKKSALFRACSAGSPEFPVRVLAYQIPEPQANMDFTLKSNPERGTSFGQFCLKEINIPQTKFEEGFKKESGELLGVFEWFRFVVETDLVVTQGGTFDFQISSDDGTILKIGDIEIIDNDAVHDFVTKDSITAGTSPRLEPGKHRISIEYFQGPRHFIGLQLKWKRKNQTDFVIIPNNRLSFPSE